MKKHILILAVIASLFVFCACGASEYPDASQPGTTPSTTVPATMSTEAEYQVSVVDALGNPCGSGVIVRFMKGDVQASMQVVNEDGTAIKTLPRDDYSVELAFTGDESAFHYDTQDLVLSSANTQVQVVLSHALTGEGVSLHANGKAYDAYSVFEGCTYVTLHEGRNYFLFTPKEAGTYEISVPVGIAGVGYYGAPHFVQEYSAVEVIDNKVQVSVKASMIGTGNTGTTVLVLGLDAEAESDCILAVKRIGEPIWDVSDEPWTVYQTTAQLSPFSLPEGTKLTDFDVTASSDTYQLVYNESDGFYHVGSVDGPLVLVRLTQRSQYLDDLKTVAEKSHVCKYFYDENGGFIKKESYNECLLDYFTFVDEATGTYPLTEDLKYIIQQRGEYYGWWNTESRSGCIFVDDNGAVLPGLNTEIAWLFLCCYEAK